MALLAPKLDSAIIRPPSAISFAASWLSSTRARALVSRHQRQCFLFICMTGLSTPLAALLISMSRRSNVSVKLSNISFTLSGSPTLPLIAIARLPISRT